MKRIFSPIVLLLAAAAVLAAGVDGKYVFEQKMPEGKGKRGKTSITTVLDLKSDGSKLTGSVTMGAGKRAMPIEIKDGKIDGNQISFTTVRKTKKGDQEVHWTGTVEGDEIKGSHRARKRSVEFTAKRQ